MFVTERSGRKCTCGPVTATEHGYGYLVDAKCPVHSADLLWWTDSWYADIRREVEAKRAAMKP